ncbi:hepatoma-derived growth factor-related protein 2 [Diabrotica virgifera virgifera]|uniref:Hepatoma-derived growth factor-related protein 2 n=1 Tax=Diabrotica virgifera virgifera TaxID=50390 RepID=A0A6P7FQF2_DIAVI|nr:hepatoma-derived growth factor-related protein 2 [Diabrotica virgifera virgifera]
MKRPNFKVGDKIFAKVKGYPVWPARIVSEAGKKFNVLFYGTGETGCISSEHLFYYLKNKKKFQKPLKRQDYIAAFKEIEDAIKKDGGDGDESPDKNDSLAADVSLDTSTANNSPVVKTEKKTPAKRKRSSVADDAAAAETSTPKKKSSRLSRNSEEPPKVEKDKDIVEPETPSKKPEEPEKVVPKKEKVVPKKTPKAKVKEEKKKADKKEEETPVEEKKTSDAGIKEETETVTDMSVEDEKPENKEKPLEIIAEHVLRHNILYANHVKKTESDYKERPVEPRDDSPDQILPVTLPSGTIAGIKLHLKWPVVVTNEYERAVYDETVANRVLETKQKIESGESSVGDDPDVIIPNIEKTEEEVKQILYAKKLEAKKAKIAMLNLEAELLNLDVKIKNCLGLDKADPKEAIGYLEDMYKLNFDAIILKKHLHIVEMVRRLRKYVGNTKEWKMNDETLSEFTKQAETVREMAEKVYGKFKQTVKLNDKSTSFFEGFAELVTRFRADCKQLELSEADIFGLSSEPKSRAAFINRLEENEKDNTDGANDGEKEKVVNGNAEVEQKS